MPVSLVTPPVGPIIPDPTGPASFTVATPTGVDSNSSYSYDIANGSVQTIIGFNSFILSNTDQAAKVAWEVQQYNASSRKEMYYASIQTFSDLILIYNAYLTIAPQYGSFYNSINNAVNTLNNQLNTYNNGTGTEQDKLTELNGAIASFNAGTMTQAQLQAFITNYNTYVASRHPTGNQTNTAITNYSNTISSINSQITALNLTLPPGTPKLRTQAPYNATAGLIPSSGAAPSSPPASTIVFTPTQMNLAVVTANKGNGASPAEIASALFQPFFDLMAGQFAITAKMLEDQSSFQGFVQFFLTNKLPFVPDEFFKPTNPTTSSGNAAPSSVSSTTLVSSLSIPTIEGIVSQSRFLAGVANEEFKLNFPQVLQQIQYIQSSLLAQLGLQAGSPALRLLGGRMAYVDLRASPVAAGVGLGLAKEAANLVESGAVLKGIKDIITKAFPNLDAQSLNSLAEKLATASELFILNASLFQLGQALGSPGLYGQVTGVGASGQPNAAAFVLADVKRLDIIKDEVSRQLASDSNISLSGAKETVNVALGASIVNDEVQQKTIVNELVQRGVVAKDALNAANLLQASIQAEIRGSAVLNQSFSSNELSKTILANELVSKITAGKSDITNRQVRDELANEFVVNGATKAEALTTATSLVVGPLGPLGVQTDPSISLYATGLDRIAGIGLGASESQAYANDLVSTVVGPSIPGSQTSIRDLITDRLDKVIKENDTDVSDKVKESMRKFNAPNLELYVFAEHLRDPANTLLYCAQTGIMYSNPTNNFNRGFVDIPA